ncbi:MAG: M23 family peptidase, partial [Gallionella sp.]
MHTIIAITFRICFRFGLFFFLFPLLAHASLPQSSSVPGGVAIIPLGSVSTSADTPQTWFADQPVLVTSDHDQWYAVVGLPLDVTPGSHEVRVKIGGVTKTQGFVVNPKDYPEQH